MWLLLTKRILFQNRVCMSFFLFDPFIHSLALFPLFSHQLQCEMNRQIDAFIYPMEIIHLCITLTTATTT